MNYKKSLIIGLICFILVFIGILLFYSFYYVVEVKSVDVSLSVINESKLSFNTETDALRFDDLYLESKARRSIKINNVHDFPVFVDVVLKGSVSKFLSTNSSFYLDENSSVSIEVLVSPSELGNFSGTLDFYFKRW